MNAIKEQLLLLTKSKNAAVSVTADLQNRYKCLQKRSAEQEKQIALLRNQNNGVKCKAGCQENGSDTEMNSQIAKTYDMLANSSELRGPSQQYCECGKKQTKRLCDCKKPLEAQQNKEEKNSNSSKYEELFKSYQEAKEREYQLENENQMLKKAIDSLRNQLNKTLAELKQLRCVSKVDFDAYAVAKFHIMLRR